MKYAEMVNGLSDLAIYLLLKHGRCDTTNYRDHHAGACYCGWRRDGGAAGWSDYLGHEWHARGYRIDDHGLPVAPPYMWSKAEQGAS